jgi:hypothetical protein
LKNLQEVRRQTQEANAASNAKRAQMTAPQPQASPQLQSIDEPSLADMSVADLEKRVDALRHKVELRVKDSGAPLKSAPYQAATTIESLPAQTEILIVVVTPYWYGIETEDGHHGWIHHSQLEPLP